MVEFANKNVKNFNIGYIFFKLNYKYPPQVFYKTDKDTRSRSKAAKQLTKNIKNLIVI